MSTTKKPAKGEETTVSKLSQFVGGHAANGPRADETMSAVVRQAVEEVCHAAPDPVIAPKDTPIAPKGLLAILAYCYAKRIYGSEEIEHKLGENEAVVAACRNNVPDAFFLRRFRRLNRAVLQACLEKVLRRAPRGAALGVPSQLDTNGNTTVVYHEAGERLDKAAFVDGLSLNN